MRGYLASMLVLAVTLLIAACGESGTPVDSDGPVSGNGDATVTTRATGEFVKTGGMGDDRQFHSAVLLDDGRVLVIGGRGRRLGAMRGAVHTSAEVYDPETEEWAPTGSMSVQRRTPIVGLLPDGTVLAGGARDISETIQKTAEIWDPLTPNPPNDGLGDSP